MGKLMWLERECMCLSETDNSREGISHGGKITSAGAKTYVFYSCIQLYSGYNFILDTLLFLDKPLLYIE